MGKKMKNVFICMILVVISTMGLDLCAHVHSSECGDKLNNYEDCIHVHNVECEFSITTYHDEYCED